MKVWALWYGGSSYATPGIRDLESFDSIAEAKQAFQRRYGREDYFYPCVDQSTEMHIFFADISEEKDYHPDRVLSIGPKGGIRIEKT